MLMHDLVATTRTVDKHHALSFVTSPVHHGYVRNVVLFRSTISVTIGSEFIALFQSLRSLSFLK
jgi:hypothetical protein